MTVGALKAIIAVDAAVIALFGVTLWLGDGGSLAIGIAIVSAMALQIILVFRPRRESTSANPPE